MSSSGVSPLKEILVLSRKDWDRDDMRADVRQAFQKVLDCRTEALGAEVFGSREEERTFFHTCKSRACPSCGRRATLLWQREQWRELPDVPYAHVTLTMPDVLWPIFRRNRHLLHDLPVLGAQVIQEWARARYGVRLMIVVIPPIAQHRFRKIDADEVTFSTRDTKTKQVVETRYTMTEFVSTLVHHIPDRYRH